MTNNEARSGRKLPPVLSDNFERLDAVGNKSNRYYYKCKHCPPGAKGERIQHRDNALLLHLLQQKLCPNAPVQVRAAARAALRAKGHVDSTEVALPDAPSNTTFTTDTLTQNAPSVGEDVTPEPTSSSDVAVKKQRTQTGSLKCFFDVGMSDKQTERANIALFRYDC